MDFKFTTLDEDFRQEVGEFVDKELPWDWRTRTVDPEEPGDSSVVKQFKHKLEMNWRLIRKHLLDDE